MCEERGRVEASESAGGRSDVAIASLVWGAAYGIKLSRRSAISVERRNPRILEWHKTVRFSLLNDPLHIIMFMKTQKHLPDS